MNIYVVKKLNDDAVPVILGGFRSRKNAEAFAAENDPTHEGLADAVELERLISCNEENRTSDEDDELPNEVYVVTRTWTGNLTCGKVKSDGYKLTEEAAKKLCDFANSEGPSLIRLSYEKVKILD
jgi:hypothetical protein